MTSAMRLLENKGLLKGDENANLSAGGAIRKFPIGTDSSTKVRGVSQVEIPSPEYMKLEGDVSNLRAMYSFLPVR